MLQETCDELWSLRNFLLLDAFGDLKQFEKMRAEIPRSSKDPTEVLWCAVPASYISTTCFTIITIVISHPLMSGFSAGSGIVQPAG